MKPSRCDRGSPETLSSNVEHGKRGILYERLIDIAEALEVSAGELFT